jgi:hypothetical protein
VENLERKRVRGPWRAAESGDPWCRYVWAIFAADEPLAESGGIEITQQVFDQVYNKIPESLARISKVELKNIQRPVEVYRIILGHPCDHDRVDVARIPFGPTS